MIRRRSEWTDVEEVDEESEYSIHQVVSYLRGRYRYRDFEKAEKLLMKREDRIREEMLEEMKKSIEVEIEVEERLRKEVEMLKQKVVELEFKAEVEERLRRKAEEDLRVSEKKFMELEGKVVIMQKDIDLLMSSEAEAQGVRMEVANNHRADAEAEAFRVASAVPSVKNVEKTAKEVVTPVGHLSAADMKQCVPMDTVQNDPSAGREKQTSNDRIPRHGIESYIEISSSSDGDPPVVQLRSKSKSDLAPVQPVSERNIPSVSDHESPEVSSGLKRKNTTSINEDKTESFPQLPTGERNLPQSEESNKCFKSVNSGQPKGKCSAQKMSLDDEDENDFLARLRPHWDEVASDSSSDL